MLKIRLSRVGRKNSPSYRIVVANQRDKRNGVSLDFLGTYDTKVKPSKIIIDKNKVKEWLVKGAQPTDTVKSILIRENVLSKEKGKKKFNDKPGKKTQARKKTEEKK